MSRRARVLLCLFALTLSSAPSPARQSQRPGPRDLARMPVVYSLPGMEKVVVKTNLKYRETGEPHQLMDVYVPPQTARDARLPAVVFIHGSVPPGAPAKDMGVFRSWGRLAAASGMVGVTFTHRLGFPKPVLEQAASDVSAAVEYVRANADALGVDKDRICLVAFSGGGPMLSAALRERPAYVRCLAAFYAFLDIQQSEPHRAHETAETLKNFSPVTHLTAATTPFFVARAGRDEVPALNDSIDRFAREALARNAPVTVFNHPQGVHAFDILTDDERSREIIRAALAFMQTHLGIKSN
jgi:acetyl esterase/lipase